MNTFLKSFLILTAMILSNPTQASTLMSGAKWESKAVVGPVTSFDYTDLSQYGDRGFIYITSRDLVVSMDGWNGLQEIDRYHFSKKVKLIRVKAGHWTDSTAPQFIVAGFRFGRPFSILFEIQESKIKKVHEFEDLVFDINMKGQSKLVRQRYLSSGRWQNEVRELKYSNGLWQEGRALPLVKSLSETKLSLLDMISSNHHVFLTGEEKLLVNNFSGKRLWKSGLQYGQPYDVIKGSRKDALGRDLRNHREEVYAGMAISHNDLFVVKNEGVLKEIVGTRPFVKASQIVHLRWSDDFGYQEVGTTQRVDAVITDLKVVDYDGDGVKDLIAVVNSKKKMVKNKGKAAYFVVLNWP